MEASGRGQAVWVGMMGVTSGGLSWQDACPLYAVFIALGPPPQHPEKKAGYLGVPLLDR